MFQNSWYLREGSWKSSWWRRWSLRRFRWYRRGYCPDFGNWSCCFERKIWWSSRSQHHARRICWLSYWSRYYSWKIIKSGNSRWYQQWSVGSFWQREWRKCWRWTCHQIGIDEAKIFKLLRILAFFKFGEAMIKSLKEINYNTEKRCEL